MNVSKAAGLLIVAIVGFLIGMDAIRREVLSLRQSEALLRLVNIMALRIGEYRSPLCEIYADYADAALEACGFLELLRCTDMRTALLQCDGLSIPKTVRDSVCRLSACLGETGSDEQLSHCRCCSAELQQIISDIRGRQPQKNRLLLALGTSGGLLLDLLLL